MSKQQAQGSADDQIAEVANVSTEASTTAETQDDNIIYPGQEEAAAVTTDENADTDDNTDDQATVTTTDNTTTDDKTTDQKPTEPVKTAPVLNDKPVVNDPGEFKPGDYSFDIVDAAGNKYTIKTPEDIDTLPEDIDFGTPANLMKAQNALNRMTTRIDAEQQEYQAKKAAFETEQKQQQEVQQTIDQLINEINYLSKTGALPAVDPKYENADWKDPIASQQPGIKERIELLDYRAKVNEQRIAANLPAMSLLEAHTQMMLDSYKQADKVHAEKTIEKRKAQGAMVGGASFTATNSMPTDMIVGEGGRISDIGL